MARRDPATALTRLIPFSPRSVLSGAVDLALRDRDLVRILAVSEVSDLIVGAETATRADDPARAAAADPRPEPPAPVDRATPSAGPGGGPGEPIDRRTLAALAAAQAATLVGAVLRPGRYPLARAEPLAAVLTAAGGASRRADRGRVAILRGRPGGPFDGRERIDLDRPRDRPILVRPGDTVQVHARPDRLQPGLVTVVGEVMSPGRFALRRGETLFSVLARAGGLTTSAFPEGAVLSRARARRREAALFRDTARALERALATELLRGGEADAERLRAARALIAELDHVEPVGRVVVEADPARLFADRSRDLLLEADDWLVIPKRPSTVAVIGEVQAPVELPYRPGRTAADYLAEAGGPTRRADDRRMYVVLPDGRAREVGRSFWTGDNPTAIPLGATIVVPRDPKPFDLLEVTESVSTILSRLAITAASFAVLGLP